MNILENEKIIKNQNKIIIILLIIILALTLIKTISSINDKVNAKKEINRIIEESEHRRETETFDFDIDSIWNLNNNQLILLIDPQSDIYNLKIQINFYDEHGEIILQKEQNIKYLKKDNQYISVVNFNEIHNKKANIKNVEYTLMEGTTVNKAYYIEKIEY